MGLEFILLQDLQNSNEIHNFGQAGNLSFFEYSFAVNKLLLVYLKHSPALCRYCRQWQLHSNIRLHWFLSFYLHRLWGRTLSLTYRLLITFLLNRLSRSHWINRFLSYWYWSSFFLFFGRWPLVDASSQILFARIWGDPGTRQDDFFGVGFCLNGASAVGKGWKFRTSDFHYKIN